MEDWIFTCHQKKSVFSSWCSIKTNKYPQSQCT